MNTCSCVVKAGDWGLNSYWLATSYHPVVNAQKMADLQAAVWHSSVHWWKSLKTHLLLYSPNETPVVLVEKTKAIKGMGFWRGSLCSRPLQSLVWWMANYWIFCLSIDLPLITLVSAKAHCWELLLRIWCLSYRRTYVVVVATYNYCIFTASPLRSMISISTVYIITICK